MFDAIDSKDFRLPTAIRPSRYRFEVALELGASRFAGKGTIELVLDRPSEAVALHAVDLTLESAQVRFGGRTVSVRWTVHSRSQTLLLRAEEPLPAGPVQVELAWTGPFSPGLRGLYRAGALAVTQFEAADARRLFPCLDEPAFKAPWAITLTVPEGVTTLSNGALAERKPAGDGVQLTFLETPPLPSYLIALVCGPIAAAPEQKVRNIPVRTWAIPEKLHLTRFGQEVALAVLPRLEDYFGLPYAFGKLDQVAVPDFEAGAMENAGLVTYRETALLLDPKTASLPTQKRVAEVITHELAHQWFGNWVTMVWWDDLWLNEAFATWMAFKIVDGWRPEWRLWLEFDKGKAEALALDALSSTHPIRAEVRNAEQAGESFDVITYEKGGAVLRMIEGYLGEGPFREGIRQYMRDFATANATSSDLWKALEAASSVPVLELADAWICQSGYPLVSVERKGREVELAQSRFYSAPGKTGQGSWPVPLVLRFQDGRGVREQRVLFRGAKARVTLEAEGEVAWLCANGGATGFYRVAYDGAGLAALARSRGALAPSERVALLSDGWALVRAGKRPIRDFLELLRHFDDEEDEAVLGELVSRLGTIEHRLVSDADRPRLRRFVARLLSGPLARVGWDAAPDEADPVRLRRASLARGVAGIARDSAAVAALRERLDRFLSGETGALEPNLHDLAVHVVAREGDQARFDLFRARFEAERDPMFKRRYLLALPSFEAEPLAARARELSLTPLVPTQDFSSYVAFLLASPISRDPFWTKMQAEWPQFLERTTGAPALLRRVIEAVGQLPERRHYEAARAFLEHHPVEAAKQAIAQTLERMGQDVELRERTQKEIGGWLDEEEARR